MASILVSEGLYASRSLGNSALGVVDIISFYFLFLDAELVSISIVFQANPSDPKTFPFILLGNKIDIDGGNSRVVSKKKAEDWCASKGNIPYFETSAKEDYNVDAAFLCIAKTALANEHEQDM
ncbi:Ras-related protein Rab7 [Vitis vinifera]|uniref:Ras-related protein Rab7 n=1 Tax=Vitis vinifera TaxID=29760 RepID=A0A438CE95_VITVI|nr:Ras-related protein Rab7 [Vitis vinifera]